MIVDGETGFLFESGDTTHLTTVLERVNASPGRALEQMGRRARAYVSSAFTPERYLSNMLDIYRSLGAG
jgi:glycosyltransferase involved in cell wall biosynthesis